MSNKRQATKKRRRVRRGFGVVYGAVTVVVAMALVLFAVTVFFKIDTIKVSGSTRYTREQICKVAEIEVGDNLYLLNKFGAINKVFLKLPYVEEIRIRRQLPGTLLIEITEAVPTLSVEHNGVYWLVSAKGKLLEHTDSEGAKTAKPVTGLTLVLPVPGEILATEPPEQGEPLFEMLRLLSYNGLLEGVGSMDFTDMYDIRFVYQDRLLVRFGLPENMQKKLAYFVEVDKQLGENAIGAVDLAGEKIIFTPRAAGE